MTYRVFHGDALHALPLLLADESIDGGVIDPPYGLNAEPDMVEVLRHWLNGDDYQATGGGFMGKSWDSFVPGPSIWREVFRVLKPGAYCLVFAGSRTADLMTTALRLAGFEIRDQIRYWYDDQNDPEVAAFFASLTDDQLSALARLNARDGGGMAWLYGTGFPKSLDVSKAIDARGGNAHLCEQIGKAIKAARLSRGISIKDADARYCGGSTLWSWFEGRPAGQQMPTAAVMRAIANDWPELTPYADAIEVAEREVIGQQDGSRLAVAPGQNNDRSSVSLDITAPATEAARKWAGWGTALKPAYEPIIVARKPLRGTVAANVLQFGTGAINIDGCRIPTDDGQNRGRPPRTPNTILGNGKGTNLTASEHNDAGRFPANIIHDGSAAVLAAFPGDEARFFYSAKASQAERNAGLFNMPTRSAGEVTGGRAEGSDGLNSPRAGAGRSSGAKNHHPTVKPVELIRYLWRLVLPPGGTGLDCFAGSGSHGVAAIAEGFDVVLIEREAEYLPIIEGRCAWAQWQRLEEEMKR